MNATAETSSTELNPEQFAKDSEQLARMEQAAQTSSDPQDIKQGKTPLRPSISHSDKVWLVVLGIVLLLLLFAHFFLNWQNGLIPNEFMPRIYNYIRGAALVAGIVLAARLLEVLAIAIIHFGGVLQPVWFSRPKR